MASAATRVPSGQSWAAVSAVAAGTFVMVTSEFLPIGLLGTIAQDLGVSEGQAGLMVTAPGLVAGLAAPALTAIAGRIDRRHLLLGFTCFILLANLVVAMAPALPAVLAGRMLLGAALGGFWTFSAAAGRRLVDPVDGDRATALILAGISIGTVVGVPLGTLLGQALGWRSAFMTVGGMTALVLFAQAALLPRLPAVAASGRTRLLSVLRTPLVRTGFVAAALLAGGHFTAYTYLQPLLSSRAGVSGGVLTTLLSAYGIAGVAGTWLAARLAARDLRGTFAGVALLIAGPVALLTVASARPLLAIALVVWGGAFGMLPVCVQLWLHRAAPAQFESSSALMVTVFQLAVAAGAFGGGRIADWSGVPSAFAAGAIFAIIAAPILLAARIRSVRD